MKFIGNLMIVIGVIIVILSIGSMFAPTTGVCPEHSEKSK